MKDDAPLTTPTTSDLPEEFARLRTLAEAALFDRDLALERERRMAAELKRLELRLSETRAEFVSLRNRLEERERYLGTLLNSRSWRLLQSLRGLLGRRW